MKAKHLLLIGIVYTSLVTAVVLSELVQSWVSGLLLLITGLAGSYYLALSHRRITELEKLERLLRNLKRVSAQNSVQDILDRLVVQAPQMVDCEQCFAVVRESGQRFLPGQALSPCDHGDFWGAGLCQPLSSNKNRSELPRKSP